MRRVVSTKGAARARQRRRTAKSAVRFSADGAPTTRSRPPVRARNMATGRTHTARSRGEGVHACGNFHRSRSRAPAAYERPWPRDGARLGRAFRTIHQRAARKFESCSRCYSQRGPLLCLSLRSRGVRTRWRRAGRSLRLAFDVHAPRACLVEISLSTPRSKSEKPSTSRIPMNPVGSQRRKQNVEHGRRSTKKPEAAICRAAGVGCPIRTSRAREAVESGASAPGHGLRRSGAPQRRKQRPPGNAGRAPARRRLRHHALERPARAALEPPERSERRGLVPPAPAPDARRRPNGRALGEGARAPARQRASAV